MTCVEKNTSEQQLRKIVREESGNNSGNNAAIIECMNQMEQTYVDRMNRVESRISIAYGPQVIPVVNDDDMPKFKHSYSIEYKVPETFKFPTCAVLPGFTKWFKGDKKSKVGPFKNIRAEEIPKTNTTLINTHKRLSDWRFVMTY